MLEHTAQENDADEIMSIGQDGRIDAHKIAEQRIEIPQEHACRYDHDGKHQGKSIAQYAFCPVRPPLSQTDRNDIG